MRYEKKNLPPGPKSVYSPSLGKGFNIGITAPKAVHIRLKRITFKRLLNWMAMDEDFEKKILDQVPEHDPPEPN